MLLFQLRHDAGLRQSDIAPKTGLSQTVISKIELGERRVDFSEVNRLCGALGLSLDEFGRQYKVAIRRSPPSESKKRRRVNKKKG